MKAADFTKQRLVAADRIKAYQVACDNSPQGNGLEDLMKKNKLPMFPDHSDPQKALENFRTLVLDADSSDHKDAFVCFNKAIAIHNLVTTVYRGARVSSDEAVELKEQIMNQIELFYKYIVLAEEAPENPDTSLLKKMSIVPVGLVAKLRLEGRYRDEPAAAGRVTARSELTKQKKSKSTKRAAGGGSGSGPGPSSKKPAKNEKDNRGMKPGAKRVYENEGKTKWHMEYPDGSCLPTPNAASCSSSGSSSSSSSSSQLGGVSLEELKLQSHLYEELQQQHAELQLKYEVLVDSVRLHNAHVDSKNQQNKLSQKNTQMAIHMVAIAPQMTQEEAARVSQMVAFPSPARKLKLNLAPDAEGGGAGEQLH